MSLRIQRFSVYSSVLLVVICLAVFALLKESQSYISLFSAISIWLPMLLVFITSLIVGSKLITSDNVNSLAVGAFSAFIVHLPFYIVITLVKTTEKMQGFLIYYGKKTDVIGIETIRNPTWGNIIQGYLTELLFMVFIGAIGCWLGRKLLQKNRKN